MNKCQICRGTENISVHSKYRTKKGEERTTFMCRPCNTERHRKYRATEKGKEKIYAAVYRSTQKHMHKQLARVKLNYHLNQGNITKPVQCLHCELEKKLEAHHEDYSKPLEVMWLCRACHSNYHRDNPDVGK